MRVLIPMVTTNTSIEKDDKFIKPLYEIGGKTIMERIIERLQMIRNAEFIFIVSKKDVKRYHIDNSLKLLVPDGTVLVANGDTQGAACSCLLAVDKINDSNPLVVVGIDQYMDIDLNYPLSFFQENNYDAGAVVFEDIHPRWSYLQVDEAGEVIRAAEKNPISRIACAGLYYYKHGTDFVNAIESMILKDASVNGQFYICPGFNELILLGKHVGIYAMDKRDHYSLTSPKGVERLERHFLSV